MTHPLPGPIVGVVDDDQRVLESLETLLESADYGVRLFSSARSLLESAYFAKIDCLISDIDMPAMDGCKLLRAVRAARPGLPVILITGHPEMLDQLSSIGGSYHGVLNKPFDGEELLETLAHALQDPGSSRGHGHDKRK